MASSTREADPLTPNPTTPRDAYPLTLWALTPACAVAQSGDVHFDLRRRHTAPALECEGGRCRWFWQVCAAPSGLRRPLAAIAPDVPVGPWDDVHTKLCAPSR
jgi:hypothetical protein